MRTALLFAVPAPLLLAVACGGDDSQQSTSPPDASVGVDGSHFGTDGAPPPGDGAVPRDGAVPADAPVPPGDGARPPDVGVDAGPPVGASVLEFHNHINRDGFFVDGALTKANAPTFHVDTTFNAALNGNVYATPLYVEHGPGGAGAFYMVTESNDVYALNETTGGVLWHKDHTVFGTPAANTGLTCGNIQPIGITGTPAIDLATRLIVFDAGTDDGQGGLGKHTIWALSIDDGSTKWSLDVSTVKDPSGLQFSAQPENQRGAVLIVNGIAYVVYGGHAGDCGPYHGWVVGVPLAGPSGGGVKGFATQAAQAGIWACGGAASDGQSIYVASGNGPSDNQSWTETEGIFRFDPGPTFTKQAVDYFAPSNYVSLDQNDIDISGSGPLVIDAPALTPSALVMGQGKDGILYLTSRSNLGGVSTANMGQLKVQNGEISNGSAWATVGSSTYVVVRPNGTDSGVNCPNGGTGANDLVAVKLDPAAAQHMTVVWCTDSHGMGSPIITSSNGTNDAMVWTMGAEGSEQLWAWDLATGAIVLDGGTVNNALPNGATARHFTTLIAAHGRVFAPADGGLYAYTH
jgi:hypothetical protein